MSTPITSRENPLIRETAGLRMAKCRRKTGLFLVEGEKMVREALKSGADIVRIFVLESYLAQDSATLLEEVGTLVHPVTERVYRHLSGQTTPCGVAAVCRIPHMQPDFSRWERLMILESVQDPGNVGAIHRICDAAGFDGMVCLSGCADPYGPKAVQAGMGAVFRVPVVSAGDGESDEALMHRIQESGFSLAAGLLDERAQDALLWSPDGGKWALVIGNESRGVSAWLARMADAALYIPVYGGAESLNAAVAAGILAYRMPGKR